MKVAVTTLGRFHHFDLARQLYKADAFAGIFTPYPRFKLRHERLPEELIHTYPFWTMVYQASMRTRNPALVEAADWIKIQDTDRRAAKSMPDCDAYIAIATTGLVSGPVAQRKGAVHLCDRPCTHVRHQQEILLDEYPLYGQKFRGIDPRVMERQEIEYQQADAVLVPTHYGANTFIERGFSPEQIRVAPYGVDLSDFYADGDRPSDTFEVLYVGQLSIRKGMKYLLEAFERFEHPKKRLTLVGSPQPSTADLVAKAVATGKVVATGALPRTQVREHMSRSHAFVIASVEEGLALVQGQAMACGCPVIASRATGCEDLYTDGIEGFIVPPRDSTALADRLQRLADEPELQKRMSAASMERVKGMGGWDAYGNAVLGHVNDLVAARRSGPRGVAAPHTIL